MALRPSIIFFRVRIDIKAGVPMQEVNSIIKSALTRDAHIAVYKKEIYLRLGTFKTCYKRFKMFSLGMPPLNRLILHVKMWGWCGSRITLQ